MQTITDELAALLTSELQAGGSGFRARVEIGVVGVGDCSTAISAAVFASTGVTAADSGVEPTISITPTPGSATVVFGACLATLNVGGYVMTWTPGSGWTTLGSGRSVAGWPFLGTMYQAVPNPSGASTPNAILDATGRIPEYLMLAASISSASSTPVQSGFASTGTGDPSPVITLAPPTLGNIIVMIATARDVDFGTLIPATGWTKLGEETIPGGSYDGGYVAIWARCADPADGNDYGFAGGSVQYNISVSEWLSEAIVSWIPVSGVKRIDIDQSLNMGAGQMIVELVNE